MVKNTPPVYRTDLMMDSGSVSGWLIGAINSEQLTMNNEQLARSNEQGALNFVVEKLRELLERSGGRYGTADSRPFLFAVGDGNHSLAAAKGIWEEYKAAHKGSALPDHPCRYALVEIENIYDPAIQFEPIHRVVFDTDYDGITSILSQLPGYSCRDLKDADELLKLCKNPAAANCFGIICEKRFALVETSAGGISTACLQPLLDKASKEQNLEIDYIHDDEEVLRLAAGDRKAAGILLPPVQKSGLFETVARTGPLPRKSFSMGHSCEKRFYLECRKIT
jgi:hypothetical protein